MSAARLSPLDSERWGTPSAKAEVDAGNLAEVLAFCAERRVGFLIARCPTQDLAAVQAMEREGFRLMDTLVYFARELARPAAADGGDTVVRPLRAGEEAAVGRIAARSFAGYLGHYHADPRLDRAQCDAVYTDWARRSCLSREPSEGVLVGESGAGVIAFATMRVNSAEEGEGVLFGVAPEAQGRGVYRALMLGGMKWCAERACARMVVSTQITNVAVQKVWSRLGFEPARSYYTFHKWFG